MQNRMKYRFGGRLGKFLAGLLVSAAVAGCVRDDTDPLAGPDTGSSGELRIAFSIDGMEADTRAVATDPHERNLKDVHVLFFTQDGNYITYQHANVTAGSSYVSFPIPKGLTAGESYRTLVIGNAHDHVPTGYSTFDAYLNHTAASGSYQTIRQDLYAVVNSVHLEGSGASGSIVLPMWGEVQDGLGNASELSFSGNAQSGYTFSGTLRFWRSVCRLDLRHDAAKDLIIEKVKLVHFRKGGYYFHNDVPWAPASGEELGGINDGKWITVGTSADLTDGSKRQEVKAQIYAFPNMVPVVVQNDKQTTYLMIAGYYQDGTDNTTANPRNKLTYYRFNMAENGRSQLLRRNHFYRGIITRVSGPGAPSESEAEDASAPLLDYTVSDTWKDDDNTTVTDERGNFLTISRAMVSFAGEKDLSETVKVQVKEGLSWSVEWVQNAADAPDYAKFTYVRSDDGSFSIRTKDDNATEFLRKARLAVKATGGTVSSSSPLTAVIDVMQLSSKDEIKVLMVDNQIGTVQYRAPGSGGTLRMQVQTGSKRSQWKVADVDNSCSSIGVTWTASGANGGMLEVDVPTNISAGERTFSLKVTRMNYTGSLDSETTPVTLSFVQPKSDYLLTVTPSVPEGQDGLVIDGFDPTVTTLKSGISVQKKFIVNLADPTNYQYSVESDFNKDYDLFLSKDRADNSTITAGWAANSTCLNKLTGLQNGESFYVNVFRTGPGDPTIRGTITIKAEPKRPDKGQAQTLSITISIKTSCIVNDVLIKNGTDYLLVADRNVGTPMRIANDRFTYAKYYTNDVKVDITGAGKQNDNKDWKGEYYPWSDAGGKIGAGTASFVEKYWLIGDAADGSTNMDEEGKFSPWYKTADKSKWVVPTQTHLNLINTNLIFSKQRAFLVSATRDKVSGDYIGCYFPLAGTGGYPANVYGYYWSAERSYYGGSVRGSYYLDVKATGSALAYYGEGLYSVRCVRSVTADEFTSAQ